MTYEIGTKVFGDWEIVREIGHGAYGHVFEIRKTEYGVTARSALKLVRIPPSEKEVEEALSDGMAKEAVSRYFRGFVDDLAREIAVMTELQSNPNIVTYQDHQVIEHTGGIGWDILIRMELLESLLKYQLRMKRIPEDMIVRLGTDMASALIACEKKGIIHRDIKPDNIFVDPAGSFKLGDFGVARAMEKTTGGLSRKGTESYMAPEVYLGRPYGKSVDIYSLGLVLYRLANRNRMPFFPLDTSIVSYADREEALSKRMLGNVLPAPCDASPELAAIILKACAYDPKERWENASEMRRALLKIQKEDRASNENITEQNSILSGVSGKEEGNGNLLEETVSLSEETAGILEETVGFSEETVGVPEKTAGASPKKTNPEIKKASDSGTDKKAGCDFTPELDGRKDTKKLAAVIAVLAVAAALVIYVLLPKAKAVTVEGGSGSGQYKEGETVTIEAREKEGCDFTGWTVDQGQVYLADKASPRTTFVMGREAVKVSAGYEEAAYQLTVEGGYIQGSDGEGSGSFHEGDRVTVVPTGKDGYTFTGWSVSNEDVITQRSGDSLIFNMPAEDFAAIAEFEETQHTLSVENGTIADEGDFGSFTEGSKVSVHADSRDGFTFNKWEVVSGDAVLNDASLQDAVVNIGSEDTVIRAVYSENRYTLSVEGGTIEGGNTSGSFKEGVLVRIEADQKDGYEFTGWTIEKGDALILNNSASTTQIVIGKQASVITADYKEKEYTLTVTDGAGGGIYKEGQTVVIKAYDKEGYTFDHWVVYYAATDLLGKESKSQQAQFDMPADDAVIEAVYIETRAVEWDDVLTKLVDTFTFNGTHARDLGYDGVVSFLNNRIGSENYSIEESHDR